MGFKEKINLNVYTNADSMKLFMSIFIWQNGEEIQLTVERLNAVYVISRGEISCDQYVCSWETLWHSYRWNGQDPRNGQSHEL